METQIQRHRLPDNEASQKGKDEIFIRLIFKMVKVQLQYMQVTDNTVNKIT